MLSTDCKSLRADSVELVAKKMGLKVEGLRESGGFGTYYWLNHEGEEKEATW